MISFSNLYHPLRWLLTSQGHADPNKTIRPSDLPRADLGLESPLLVLSIGHIHWDMSGDKGVLFSSIQTGRLPPALTI